MKTVCEMNQCNGCMACISSCPKKCITVVDDVFVFNAVVNEDQCINCHLCEKTCPNINKPLLTNSILWNQGWTEGEIRNSSSSGGVASSIIKSFIKSGGYVASCLFENGDFIFSITNDLKKVQLYSGSKYVKSNPIGIYEKVKKCLESNKVLFVGLPCQVAAVKNYCNNHVNLYTVDLICHGTPSVKILLKYLEECGYSIEKIQDIRFRNKGDFGISINGERIVCSRVIDEYMCGFLESINYTENCYNCQFATIKRVSDVSLGDSWGSELEEESLKGISLVLTQTEKGKELLKLADLCLHDVNSEKAISNNKQLKHPSVMKRSRKIYIWMLKKNFSVRFASRLCMPFIIIKQIIKKHLIRLHVFP